ncbi:MAG: hypothetical protein HKN87_08885 [Saprospiraceae bacterium]|nr:hypothetical protein [Saprospiraceae bacterium]
MKKTVLHLILLLGISFAITSCFTYTMTVGQGAQSGVETRQMNHYLIYGLAPIDVSNPTEMAGGAEDYEVTIQHTFVDGLLNAITFGIYTPTTTIVKK